MSRKRIRKLLGAAAIVGLPVIFFAPKNEPGRPDIATIDDAIEDCKESGKTGWELVDYATGLVNEKFTAYSLWHLWENIDQAFHNGRGYSDQYNLALAKILKSLGFEVRGVHAARVRKRDIQPAWWHSGHTWLKVTYDGRTLDVCAAQPDHRAGHVSFTPISDVRELNPWTPGMIRLLLIPFSLIQVWGHLLTGNPTPKWFYRKLAK